MILIFLEILVLFLIQKNNIFTTSEIILVKRSDFLLGVQLFTINLLIYLVVFFIYIYEMYYLNEESGLKNCRAFDTFYIKKINSKKMNNEGLIISIVNFELICEKKSRRRCFKMIRKFLFINKKIKCIYLKKGTFLFLSKDSSQNWKDFHSNFTSMILNKKKSAKISSAILKFDTEMKSGNIEGVEGYIDRQELGIFNKVSMKSIVNHIEKEEATGEILDYCLEYNDRSILPYFQPIFDVKKQRITRYEVLMRFRYKQKILSPYPFICFAEKNGLISILDMYLYEAFFDKISNGLKNSKFYKYSINLSGIELNTRFIEEFIKKMKEYKIPKNCITFEITETSAYEFDDNFVRYLKKLQKEGFKVAIDDFGSGFSNFNLLRVLDVDFVKIDGSLIKDIAHDKKARERLRCIVDMLKLEKVAIIAEFVETEELKLLLCDMGIDYLQGYYIGKPNEDLSLLEEISD